MVNYKEQQRLDRVFASLADPTRRAILQRVAAAPLSVSAIAQPYRMSLPAVSKHLKVLEQADLIIRRKTGRQHLVQLNPRSLKTVADYLERYRVFWNERLDALEEHLSKRGGDTP